MPTTPHYMQLVERKCQECGATFRTEYHRVKAGRGVVCSPRCAGIRAGRARGPLPPTPGTKAQKVRANGLINMRLRRGLIQKPEACQTCGARKRLDAHHRDYSKPDEVVWLCRSCHMAEHHAMAKQLSSN